MMNRWICYSHLMFITTTRYLSIYTVSTSYALIKLKFISLKLAYYISTIILIYYIIFSVHGLKGCKTSRLSNVTLMLVLKRSEVMWTSGVFCTQSETMELCLDCCVTLATALLALDILWRHFFSQSNRRLCAVQKIHFGCLSSLDVFSRVGNFQVCCVSIRLSPA